MTWTEVALHILFAGIAFFFLGVILAHFIAQYPPGKTPSPLWAIFVSPILMAFLVGGVAWVFGKN